jgi:hypothetical protein
MNLPDLWQGALLVLHPINLAYITFGVLIGFVVGALPGISGPNAMALLMPLAFVTRRESTLMMFAGAQLFAWLERRYRDRQEGNVGRALWVDCQEPIAAGIVAGAALTGIGDQLITVFVLGG